MPNLLDHTYWVYCTTTYNTKYSSALNLPVAPLQRTCSVGSRRSGSGSMLQPAPVSVAHMSVSDARCSYAPTAAATSLSMRR